MHVNIDVSKVFDENYKSFHDPSVRVIVNEGSSRSTKTYSIIQNLINLGLENTGLKFTISRARLTWLKATLVPDFYEILEKQFNCFREQDKRDSGLRYILNGNEYSFIGLDEDQKLHGRKQDYAWINEAIETRQKDFQQLALRTTKQLILDYNPSTDSHWIYDSVIPRKDCVFIKSTYKDNPFLTDVIRNEIERLKPTPDNIAQGTADEISWKIYGLGERASQKGLIFGGDVGLTDYWPPLDECKKRFYGLDFGYTNDPTTVIEIRLHRGTLYFKEHIYRTGLVNIQNANKPGQKSIEGEMLRQGIPFDARIWADSAEPKSIQEIRNAGWFNIRGAKKGKDSIVNGIDTIKRYPSFITNDSINLIKERNNYKWGIDKNGKATNKPIDNWNHGWDGIRYGCMSELDKPVASPSIRSLD